jgi:hypothetical protein
MMGVKTLGDERKKLVTRRQNEAKAAMRRYVDDVTFQVGKDSRDMLRGVQRDLRDHFTELAEQLTRSLRESLTAAERSVTASKEDGARRLAEIGTELATLEELQAQTRTLLPGQDASPTPEARQPVAAGG